MVAVDIRLRGVEALESAMTTSADLRSQVANDPDAVARQLLEGDESAARALAQAIERRLATGSLDQLERVWDLSAAQAASLFGVSRQAYAKWRISGIPADRRSDAGEIGAIKAMLLDFVKVDRIPGVVRRAADELGGSTIVDRVREDPRAARLAVERMLDLRRVQP